MSLKKYNRERLHSRLLFLCSLIFVLAVLNVLARVPWESSRSYRLTLNRGDRSIPIEILELRQPQRTEQPGQKSQAPLSQITIVEDEGVEDADTEDSNRQEDRSRAIPEMLRGRDQILDFAEEPPSIVGGLGSYYINIAYPQEAVDANIQGRLILRFVVDVDGSTHSIDVIKSLHPLCDSAAVRAVRLTTFTPGVQNGVPVPVRMSLPVVFRIVGPGESPIE